ncbi:spherulation-specific family 4 protein [Streptomyces sp. URMC 123]|uniref:spherulation-specific family 4 protein n=1 Tax=Streptomyces sp. URMC 123 TaxID=3423403 RepID=UPI003F19E082
MLVPLYVHPAEDPAAWRALIRAAPSLYGVVLNVADGPGTAPDPVFAAAVGALHEANVLTLGYVDTGYGRRPYRAVLCDVRRHRRWYATSGVFLDQVPADAALLGRYRMLARGARALGAHTVALNPGVPPAKGYGRIADLLVTFEGDWSMYRTVARPSPAWLSAHPPERVCHLVHGVPAGLCALAARMAGLRGAGVHCAVPGGGPNPWRAVPPAVTAAARAREEDTR